MKSNLRIIVTAAILSIIVGAKGVTQNAEGVNPKPVVKVKASQSTKQPNILWIIIEDAYPFLGCYGDEVAKTPNIDRFAERATRFTNAFSSGPSCSPARSTLITGMNMGMFGAGGHRSVVKIPDFVKGFPSYLRKAGYYCTNYGKTDYNFESAVAMSRRCWDDYSVNANWRNRAPGQPFFSVITIGTTHQSRTAVNSRAHFERIIQSQLSPEEICVPKDVVMPPFYHDSPRMRKAYARMYDCFTLVDRQVGELLKRLADDGLANNTIVFFFADNGQGMPRFKTCPLALGVQVPLIVHVPEKFRSLVDLKPGTVSDAIVSFEDLGPTVMNIAGIEIPDYMSGVTVLGPGKVEKTFYYGGMEHNGSAEDHCRNVYDGRYFYLRNYMPHLAYTQSQIYNDGAEILTFMRQDYKAGILSGAAAEYMEPTRPKEALYDLKRDPWQVNNLANDPKHQEILNRLRARNREWILDIRDVHFLHAWEIETRGVDKTACEIRSNPDVYPLERILEIAELTGGGASVLDKQLAALSDKEPMLRYWAIIGLQSQEWRNDAIMAEVIKRLDDGAPYVRYEAAKLAYLYSKNKKAKTVLVAGINEPHSILVNHAIRCIRQLNKSAADFLPELEQFKQSYKQRLTDNKRLYAIGASIEDIENYLAGRYAKPVDSF